jgi:hypothetical protein
MHPSYKPPKRERLNSFYAENLSQAGSNDDISYSKRRNSTEIDLIAKNYFGIGFKINQDEIETCLQQHDAFNQIGSYNSLYGPMFENGPSVVVISFSETMILEKFRVCCLIWDLKLNASYKI